MKSILPLVLVLALALGAQATEISEQLDDEQLEQQAEDLADAEAAEPVLEEDGLQFLDAREIDVRDFIWTHRIVVVMAETRDDPNFSRQLEALLDRAEEFVERDVVVIFDADPADRSPLRQVLRPRGFMMAIIDKDGEVKARRPAVRSGRELINVIDRFPSRRQEALDRRPAGR